MRWSLCRIVEAAWILIKAFLDLFLHLQSFNLVLACTRAIKYLSIALSFKVLKNIRKIAKVEFIFMIFGNPFRAASKWISSILSGSLSQAFLITRSIQNGEASHPKASNKTEIISNQGSSYKNPAPNLQNSTVWFIKDEMGYNLELIHIKRPKNKLLCLLFREMHASRVASCLFRKAPQKISANKRGLAWSSSVAKKPPIFARKKSLHEIWAQFLSNFWNPSPNLRQFLAPASKW